ncbi:three-Cys-motif partner protein TcmP [uncultured Microbulbifer sp.]|uniref:three-Cys-motif partner protein TcmP n=1 Tax=uncultured Microbulbifer sp. TaxID=348147 RepID=UPI00260D478D|nr:three-Cys-motif partner protein TcmP [uncultured Microbulbifer sp.]
MAKKIYDWEGGAILEDHTKKKHKILKEYFRKYLLTRCQLPQCEKFRVSIVDAFSGAGVYACNSFGSPLIFVEVLKNTTREINISRLGRGMKPIKIECILILNDKDKAAINHLKENISPLLAGIQEERQDLTIHTEYFCEDFDKLYPKIKNRLLQAKFNNVFFNLDQCGYTNVTSNIIRDITQSWRSAEILLTYMIASLLTYLSPASKNSNILEPEIKEKIFLLLEDKNINKQEWLSEAEIVVFRCFKGCATYISPFSINNPKGWRYWLMHFANNYRARQVYNDVLHDCGEAQAHCGKAGLNMLSYDPSEATQLYLFNSDSRHLAKESLYDDIPRLVAKSGDTMRINDFYAETFSETPAHSDDIHEMIIENPDLEVITEAGGTRKKPNTIKVTDTLKVCSQRSWFSMFKISEDKERSSNYAQKSNSEKKPSESDKPKSDKI